MRARVGRRRGDEVDRCHRPGLVLRQRRVCGRRDDDVESAPAVNAA